MASRWHQCDSLTVVTAWNYWGLGGEGTPFKGALGGRGCCSSQEGPSTSPAGGMSNRLVSLKPHSPPIRASCSQEGGEQGSAL